MFLSRLPRPCRRRPSIPRIASDDSPLLARLLSAFLSTGPTWRATPERRPREDRYDDDLFPRNLGLGGSGEADYDDGKRQGSKDPPLRRHRFTGPGGLRGREHVDGPSSRGDLSRKRPETPQRSRNGVGDLFPDLDDYRSTMVGSRRGLSGQMSGRREHQDDLGPSQRTMRGFGDVDEEKFDSSSQRFHSPLDDGLKESNRKLGPGHPMAGDAASNGGDSDGETLLQRLDFGVISGRKREKGETERPSNASSGDETAASEAVMQDADEIFKNLKETGLIPNAVAMLDGLCKDGLIQEAMKLFGSMREKGTMPEVVIYTAVVEGFCKASKFDDAMRIFKKMQKNCVVPNAFSCTVLIQGLTKGGRLDDAIEFCLEMLDLGHSPNVATFIGFLDRFCREKGVEHAEDVIRRLQERGFTVDEKAVREYLDKKGPFSPMVWESIFGKKPQRHF